METIDSKTYWKNREEENLRSNLKEEEEYVKEINRIYDRMMVQITKEINDFYVRYAKKEGISISEARKRVKKLDINAYAEKAKKYVKEKDFSDEANEEMRLYNLTMKVNRLELLKAQIGLELVDNFNDLQKYFDEKLTKRTLDEFKRQAGILGKTLLDNEKAAHAVVNASFHNATFSDRIWLYQGLLKNDLYKLLQTGIVQGKNPRVLAADLAKKFNVSRYNAERLMRTELARVQTEAQKQSFERNGFEEYTFLALGDACPICKALDEKHFKVKRMMPGENAPPMHPRCRCSVAAYEDGEDYEAWLDFLDKGGTTTEWEKLKKKGKTVENSSKGGTIKERNISSRKMSNGLRTSPYHILTDEEIEKLKVDAEALEIPLDILRFNEGRQTGFSDRYKIIYVKGDVLPDRSSSNLRDMLSQKAVLAHEYYGHYKSHPSLFRIGDWRDEFRASYRAAIDSPNLSDSERRMLMLDAYDRAKEAGVNVKYNKEARRLIYGYDE